MDQYLNGGEKVTFGERLEWGRRPPPFPIASAAVASHGAALPPWADGDRSGLRRSPPHRCRAGGVPDGMPPRAPLDGGILSTRASNQIKSNQISGSGVTPKRIRRNPLPLPLPSPRAHLPSRSHPQPNDLGRREQEKDVVAAGLPFPRNTPIPPSPPTGGRAPLTRTMDHGAYGSGHGGPRPHGTGAGNGRSPIDAPSARAGSTPSSASASLDRPPGPRPAPPFPVSPQTPQTP